MTGEAALRVAAGLAAVVIAFAPLGVAAARKARAWWQAGNAAPAVTGASETDMHLVLDLASRLRARQCDAGVTLCQSLLRVMLAGCKDNAAQESPKASE